MAMTRASALLVAAVVLTCSLVFSPLEAANVGDFPDGGDADVFLDKRPFCNAFTGCGKKRSSQEPTSALDDLLRKLGRHVSARSRAGFPDDVGRWLAGPEGREKRSLVVPRVVSG